MSYNKRDKMGNKKYIAFLLVLVIISTLSFVLSQNNPVVYQGDIINENYLESLRLEANVECLQNSQCSEGYECVANKCLETKKINNCKDIGLSTSTRRLKDGDFLNAYKRVITGAQLSDLLTNGELVEVVDNQLIEYFYTQVILIGNSKIEKEDLDYLIKTNSNEPIYILRITFSKSVDFSSRNIQGQVLRILGKEYVIGTDSTNSVISLISNTEEIKLEKLKNVKMNSNSLSGTIANIEKDSNGEVAVFEIAFNMPDNSNIKVGKNAADSVFDAIKLSFNSVDVNDFADVRIGGKC